MRRSIQDPIGIGRRRLYAAVLVSCAVHAGGLALLARQAVRPPIPTASFAGYRRAITLEATFSPAQWSDEPTVEISREPSPPTVVVQPRAARVAQHRYVASEAGDVPLSEQQTGTIVEHDPKPVVTRLGATMATRNAQPDLEPGRQQRAARRRTIDRRPSVESAARPPGTGIKVRARFIHNGPPKYPDRARLQGWQGTVWLRLVIDRLGNVVSVDVVQSSGHAILDAAAVAAVRRWRGEPARDGGVAIETQEYLPVQFEIPNR